MVILEHEITLIGSKGRRQCIALFDSGASYSIIRPDIADAIATPAPLPDPEDWVFQTAIAGQTMQATQVVPLSFRFEDSEARFTDEFILLDGSSEEVIIGATTMQKWGIKLDFETEQINYRKTAEKLRLV